MTTHTVSFASRYKSITALATIELPPFVVLTGRNGSGKSHLLEALEKGHVRSSRVANPASEIVRYDWNTIIPQDTGAYVPAAEKMKRSQWFGQLRNVRDQHLAGFEGIVASHGLPHASCATWDKVRRLFDPSHLQTLVGDPQKLHSVSQALNTHARNVAASMRGQVGHNPNDPLHKDADRLLADNPTTFLFDDESQFFRRDPFVWGQTDAFRQAFGRLFSNYRDLQRANFVRVGASQHGHKGEPGLGPSEFENVHGRPPWEFVNRILDLNGLDFFIDHPPLDVETSYEPTLTKRSKDVEMRFADLSSGERVLMSFALCLYNSLEKRQARVFPKLLLLDEVDAPLHPSMVRFLLRTIDEALVRDSGVSVILTTHKPTTVGLASDAAVYLMNPAGPTIEKTTKSSALAILTEGIPTMSISFDGRRQVFVESSRDAQIYDRLFQRYKSEYADERSLAFVPVGHTNEKGQDTGTGCDQVRSIVGKLTEGGNATVLGLVDWDGKQHPAGRVHVLCHGIRDGLENLLLDPVLVIASLGHHSIGEARSVGVLCVNETFSTLSTRSADAWQRSVDLLTTKVFETNEKEQRVDVTYHNGMALIVDRRWFTTDDHALEQRILKALPVLNAPKAARRSLMKYVAEIILEEHPSLAPADLLATFRQLLSAST